MVLTKVSDVFVITSVIPDLLVAIILSSGPSHVIVGSCIR